MMKRDKRTGELLVMTVAANPTRNGEEEKRRRKKKKKRVMAKRMMKMTRRRVMPTRECLVAASGKR
jgi:hypothetical protein